MVDGRREADPLYKWYFRAEGKCKWVYKIQTYINIHTSIYLYMQSLRIQSSGCIIAISLQVTYSFPSSFAFGFLGWGVFFLLGFGFFFLVLGFFLLKEEKNPSFKTAPEVPAAVHLAGTALA